MRKYMRIKKFKISVFFFSFWLDEKKKFGRENREKRDDNAKYLGKEMISGEKGLISKKE
jgi:hypothetical protein